MTTGDSFGSPSPRTFARHPSVELANTASLPTELGNFRIHVFTSDRDSREQVAIVHGAVFGLESVPTRVDLDSVAGLLARACEAAGAP